MQDSVFREPERQGEDQNLEGLKGSNLPELDKRYDTPLSSILPQVVDADALYDALQKLKTNADQDSYYDGLTSETVEERRAYMVAPLYRQDIRQEVLSALAYMILHENDKGTELAGGISLFSLVRDAEKEIGDRNVVFSVATSSFDTFTEPTRVGLTLYLETYGGTQDVVRDFFLRQLRDPLASDAEKAVCGRALEEWSSDTKVILEDCYNRIESLPRPDRYDYLLFAKHADRDNPPMFSRATVEKMLDIVKHTHKDSEQAAIFRALTASQGHEALVSTAMYDLLNTENQEIEIVVFATNIVALHSKSIEDPEAFIAPFVDRVAEHNTVMHSLFGQTLSEVTVNAMLKGRPVRDDVIDVLPTLYRLARSDEPSMQAAALRVFAYIGEEASDALPEIGTLLSSEDLEVRRLAAVAAMKLGSASASLRNSLIEGVHHGDDEYTRVLSALSLASLDFKLEADIAERTTVESYEDQQVESINTLNTLYFDIESDSAKQAILITLARVIESPEDMKAPFLDALQSDSLELHEGACSAAMVFDALSGSMLEALGDFARTGNERRHHEAQKLYDYFNDQREGDF